MALDPRIVRVGIEIEGAIKWYEGLNIRASGTKFNNQNGNECTVEISNLSKDHRDYILSESSMFLRSYKPKKIFVEAGRQSTGAAQVFVGDITSAIPSQPPDITLTIKAVTQNTASLKLAAVSYPDVIPLSTIAKDLSRSLGLALRFEATDRQVASYSFTGGRKQQLQQLSNAIGVDAFIDDETLIVKNKAKTVKNASILVSSDTGMVGVPEITAQGVRVQFLFNPSAQIGGAIEVRSKINPAANGLFEIYKLTFDISSRQTQFYNIVEGFRL